MSTSTLIPTAFVNSTFITIIVSIAPSFVFSNEISWVNNGSLRDTKFNNWFSSMVVNFDVNYVVNSWSGYNSDVSVNSWMSNWSSDLSMVNNCMDNWLMNNWLMVNNDSFMNWLCDNMHMGWCFVVHNSVMNWLLSDYDLSVDDYSLSLDTKKCKDKDNQELFDEHFSINKK